MITVSAAVLNVAVNVVLIPRIGILGAAWATFAAYAWFAGATWWYARRVYPVRLELRPLAVLSLATLLALALAALTDPAPANLTSILLRGLIAVGFGVVAAGIAFRGARRMLRTPKIAPDVA
jgi:O-antigen/teichoic acid export membrane protein